METIDVKKNRQLVKVFQMYQRIGVPEVKSNETKMLHVKVILCASEHICSIVRYCFRSYKQL